MPAIPPPFIDCALRLYPSAEAARSGRPAGGSGFLAAVKVRGRQDAGTLYAVTNRHLVAAGATVVRLDTHDGHHDVLDVDRAAWTLHPDGDDLAIARVDLPPAFRFSAVPAELLIKRDIRDRPDWPVGADVFAVGRFVTREGTQLSLPTAQFGHVARLPVDPAGRPSGVTEEASLESFLVELQSFGGHRGSPVFSFRPIAPQPGDLGVAGTRIRLLGVASVRLPAHRSSVEESSRALEPSAYPDLDAGMTVVVPAWRLRELLNGQLAVSREQAEEELPEKLAERGPRDIAIGAEDREAPLTRAGFYADLERATLPGMPE
jgi:hypothetical protein